MTASSLLLVEDDRALATGLIDSLTAEGWEVRHVDTCARAEEALQAARPTIVLLDLMLPDGSGLDLLRTIRRSHDDLPVVVLTSKGDVVDRVVGLELGADDYVPKPFAVRELVARLHAVLRRARGAAGTSRELTLGDLTFDFGSLTARSPDGPVDLTTHAILVLKVLADARGEIVGRLDIVEEVCGLDSATGDRTVDNHIVALRRALGEDPKSPRWIRTVRGRGYRLALPDDS